MIVYRVENANGVGPYCPPSVGGDKDVQDYFLEKHNNSPAHPVAIPPSHFCLGPMDEVRYCFPSLEMAFRWFTLEDLELLALFGFHLKELQVPDDDVYVFWSGEQAVFRHGLQYTTDFIS